MPHLTKCCKVRLKSIMLETFQLFYTSHSSMQNSCLLLTHFLLPLSYYCKVMEALFPIKIFDVEFLPNLYVLKSSKSKKVVFGNLSVHMYVCDCNVNI